jgi:hypothetical protein
MAEKSRILFFVGILLLNKAPTIRINRNKFSKEASNPVRPFASHRKGRSIPEKSAQGELIIILPQVDSN